MDCMRLALTLALPLETKEMDGLNRKKETEQREQKQPMEKNRNKP